mmetsp:Transcript_21226/g.51293  ORF Transcript_21226/g.51293 Transcript_21226/m.51293 type:complete len:430 (+) Transcript_21226:459-1748(+)
MALAAWIVFFECSIALDAISSSRISPSTSLILSPYDSMTSSSVSSVIPSVTIEGRPRYSSPTILAALSILSAASSIPTSTSRAVPIASWMDRSLLPSIPPPNDIINFSASTFPSDLVVRFSPSAFSCASPHSDRAFATSERPSTMTSLARESDLQSRPSFPAAVRNSSSILSITLLHPSANCLMYLPSPMAFSMLPSLILESTAEASMFEMASVILSTSEANVFIISNMRWHSLLLSLMASNALFPASTAVSNFKFSTASMHRVNSSTSPSIRPAIPRSSAVSRSVTDLRALFSTKLSTASGRAPTPLSRDSIISMDSAMHLVDLAFMASASSFASLVLSPSIRSAMTANDSASRSSAAPTSERWMDSPHDTRFLPVATVDEQSSTVCLAELWHCLMPWWMDETDELWVRASNLDFNLFRSLSVFVCMI